jgi:hypothetical protein
MKNEWVFVYRCFVNSNIVRCEKDAWWVSVIKYDEVKQYCWKEVFKELEDKGSYRWKCPRTNLFKLLNR